ncbi:MAG: hypothetical protein V5783_07535 [Pontiella sp.]
MHLNTLEIVGFKSFSTKIYPKFESGMTAILDSNGCGKNNVSDTVRGISMKLGTYSGPQK